MNPQKIGVFGGTFDPPHIGHLILASEACYQLDLQSILWVLTPNPPHKPNQPITPLIHRLSMLQVCLVDEPCFNLSRVDIDRSPPHYALDTMRILRSKYPDVHLVYLMGGDSLHDLPNWHHPQEFIRVCQTVGVMHRPGEHIDLTTLETLLPGITEKTRFIEAPMLEISSSLIRQNLQEGRPFRYYLLPPVYSLIKEHNLYR